MLPWALSWAAAAKPVMLEIIAWGSLRAAEGSPLQGVGECRQLDPDYIGSIPASHAPAGEPAASSRLCAERLSHRETALLGRVQHRLPRARREGRSVRHQGVPALLPAAARRRGRD